VDVAHFYHLYAAGRWREPVTEHLAALSRVGFDNPLYAGLVGSRAQRAVARDALAQAGRSVVIVAEADDGWEQVTLCLAHRWARENDGAVLYAHTKGAYSPGAFQDAWRRSMTSALLSDLEGNLKLLEAGYEAIGSHWLTPEEFPPERRHTDGRWTTTPYFGGNFWLATAAFLRTLPEPALESRHDAEVWLGRGSRRPRVHDLVPGWPLERTFRQHGWPG
jgi:hypothetical protein